MDLALRQRLLDLVKECLDDDWLLEDVIITVRTGYLDAEAERKARNDGA